jgi:hypothetical protein
MSMINDHNYKFFLPEAPPVVMQKIISVSGSAPSDNRKEKYNPGDVFIELVNENSYIAYKRQGKDQKAFHVPAPWGNIYKWANALDDSQLEAAIQMFYDKWNFKADSSDVDRTCLDVALDERKRRQSPKSSFAPMIFSPNMGEEEEVYMKDNFVTTEE